MMFWQMLFSNSQNADVLIVYGAKYNQAILEGQYWRFVTPIFLHAEHSTPGPEYA